MTAEVRRCLSCGHTGQMKTWLGNYSFPQFLVLLGLLFYILPGVIFIAWAWGKFKCPNCGALDKNTAAPVNSPTTTDARDERECPWCAETILVAAKICKHCGKEVPPLSATNKRARSIIEIANAESEERH